MALKKGQRGARIRLTEDQAKAVITRVAAGAKSKNLAEEYGVSPSTISRIVNGQTWVHLERPPTQILKRATKLTAADVLVIKARLQRGDRLVDIARDYNVSGPAIAAIRDGRTWQEVVLPPAPRPTPAPTTRRKVWER